MREFETDKERKAFELGMVYTQQYIIFCMKNYVYQMNLGGAIQFIRDLIDFINGSSYIPNKEKITFPEFYNRYSVKE